ncbi:MAG: GTP cyclohydrolase I [Hymenobacter sp.]
MYVQEWFNGLNPAHRPEVPGSSGTATSTSSCWVERDITVFSCCEHHFVPIIGKAHVAYLPGSHVVGLSKLNRAVQAHARRRPQVQERRTRQVAEHLRQSLEAPTTWPCSPRPTTSASVTSRGANVLYECSSTITSEYGGRVFRRRQLRCAVILRQIGK